MSAYAAYREKVFLPVRPLHHYLTAFRKAKLKVKSVNCRTIEARVKEWFEFLSVYHDAVLGWIGGVEKIDGQPPSPKAVKDRLAAMRAAMQIVFEGRESFQCSWTYVTCATAKR